MEKQLTGMCALWERVHSDSAREVRFLVISHFIILQIERDRLAVFMLCAVYGDRETLSFDKLKFGDFGHFRFESSVF